MVDRSSLCAGAVLGIAVENEIDAESCRRSETARFTVKSPSGVDFDAKMHDRGNGNIDNVGGWEDRPAGSGGTASEVGDVAVLGFITTMRAIERSAVIGAQ